LGIFSYGVLTSILGSVLPSLSAAGALSPAQSGSLFLFLNLGAFISTVAIGAAFDRFGFRAILVASALGGALGCVVLSGAATFRWIAGASFFLGLSGALVNLGTNALVADLYPRSHGVALNRLGGFFGIGSFLAPFLTGMLLEKGGLPTIFLVAAGLSLVPAAAFLGFEFPAPKHATGLPVRDLTRAVTNPLVACLGVLLLFQAGAEATTGAWLTSLLVVEKGMSPASAALVLAGYWGSFAFGRLSASWLLRHLSPGFLVQVGSVGGTVFLAVFLITESTLSGWIMTILAGFSMSVVFPTVLGQAAIRFPSFSGTVIGTLFAIGLIGSMSMPWIAGLVAGRFGLPAALVLPVFSCVIVLGLQRQALRISSSEDRSGEQGAVSVSEEI